MCYNSLVYKLNLGDGNVKKATIFVVCLLLILVLTACGKDVTWNGDIENLAIVNMVFDCANLYEYVGVVDYVFVGTVEDIESIVIPDNYEQTDSTYKIHVDNNLKGELVENIICSKMGGLNKDGTMLLIVAETPQGELIADTGLPELGKQYVFLAYAQPNGSLTLSEIFDNREYNEGLLEEYMEYVNNEILFERERFVSEYSK